MIVYDIYESWNYIGIRLDARHWLLRTGNTARPVAFPS